MTDKIITTVVFVAAVFAAAVASSAQDGVPMYAFGGCSCGSNGYGRIEYGYHRDYSAMGESTYGNCGYQNTSCGYNQSPPQFRGDYMSPLRGGPYPAQRSSPTFNRLYESQSPNEFERNREPTIPAARPFGSGVTRQSRPNAGQSQLIPDGMEGIAQLTTADQIAALRQQTCPVTQEPLGSMGKPIRVTFGGQSVFVCCEGCVTAVKRSPEKYLRGASTRDRSLIR